MRERKSRGGVAVRAIAGTHVVLLGMNATKTARKGLLGFAIQREDVTEHEKYWLRGLKTFEEVVPIQVPGVPYSLLEHPVQTFRWADYTAKPDHEYVYTVVPLRGTPKALVQGQSVVVEIETEAEGDASKTHDVYFNRGVAGSQAYARRFGNIRPDDLPAAKRAEALAWLSRGLEEAMLAFIGRAKGASWGLRAAVYEFDHEPALEAFKKAKKAGADVRIVYDKRKGGPGDTTEEALKKVGIKGLCTPRETNSYIAHNKFVVLLHQGKPIEVWTGSTNFTRGGIFGQSNVGHLVRDATVAQAYLDYWTRLEQDPEAKDLRTWIQGHTPDPSGPPARGTTALFSPRKGDATLQWYADRLGDAGKSAHMTAAFGVHDYFEKELGKQKAHLRYVLLERRDENQFAWTQDRDVSVAVGSKISGDALYGWAGEVLTEYNHWVEYVHDKFLLVDPLSNDPLVITGSANFSKASTVNNDENMLVIRGDTRVADVYLGEFMRLFSHHYFRQVIEAQEGTSPAPVALYLTPNDSWTNRYYKPYSVKLKERLLYSGSAS